MEQDPAVTDAVVAAQAQLRQITSELEGIRFRLLGVHASLAATLSRGGLAPTGPGHMEISAEIVSAVECVLIDRIGPALRSLQEAVHEEESPSPGGEENR
jgi:chloramphenicol 3-O-phosphotransferase